MKNVRKLELYSGVAMVIAALIQLLFFLFSLDDSSDSSFSGTLVLGFLFLLLPCLILFVAAYQHTAKQSRVGLVVILIGGGIFVCFYGCIFLMGLLSGAEIKPSHFIWFVMWILPSFFVATTVILALINNTKNDYKE